MLISQLVLRSASTASPHIQSTHEIYGRKRIMVDHLPLIETSRARARAQPQPKRSPMNDKTIAHTHTHESYARSFGRVRRGGVAHSSGDVRRKRNGTKEWWKEKMIVVVHRSE